MEGLRKWGKAMYGDHPPERLRAKLQRFDDRMRKVQETSEKRRQHMLLMPRRWRRGIVLLVSSLSKFE